MVALRLHSCDYKAQRVVLEKGGSSASTHACKQCRPSAAGRGGQYSKGTVELKSSVRAQATHAGGGLKHAAHVLAKGDVALAQEGLLAAAAQRLDGGAHVLRAHA